MTCGKANENSVSWERSKAKLGNKKKPWPVRRQDPEHLIRANFWNEIQQQPFPVFFFISALETIQEKIFGILGSFFIIQSGDDDDDDEITIYIKCRNQSSDSQNLHLT